MMMKIIMMGIMKIETSDNYNITKMIFIILVFLLWVVMLVFCFLITSCGMAYYRYKYNYVYDKNFIKPPNFVDYYHVVNLGYWKDSEYLKFGFVGGFGIYPKSKTCNAIASMNLESKLICCYLLQNQINLDLIVLIMSYLYE